MSAPTPSAQSGAASRRIVQARILRKASPNEDCGGANQLHQRPWSLDTMAYAPGAPALSRPEEAAKSPVGQTGGPRRLEGSAPSASLAGFTSTDLLVGAAAASLVAALVLIPLTRMQGATRLARCTSNLQQVSKAILQFAEEHNKALPATVPGQSEELQWWYKDQVKGYVGAGAGGSTDSVFACPDDRGYSDSKPFHSSARFNNGSYVFNGVMIPGAPNIAGWPVSSIVEPKRTLLVMEWAAHGPLSWHRSRTGKKNAPFYNDAECVVGFVDGRVSLTPIYYDGHTPAYLRDPIPGYAYRYTGQ